MTPYIIIKSNFITLTLGTPMITINKVDRIDNNLVIDITSSSFKHQVIELDNNGNEISRSELIDTTPIPIEVPVQKTLVTLSNFEHIGSFKVPNTVLGSSRAGYSIGQIALGKNRDSIFLAGHQVQKSIAEFSIPALVQSVEWKDLNVATNIQPFTTVINRTSSPTTQNMDRIGGMCLVDNKLIVNVFEYYDGPADNTFTTLVLDNASDIGNCNVVGFHGYDAKAHAAGWISKIPEELQSTLGGSYIAGDSSGRPINGRNSIGPSAFAFNANSVVSQVSPITIPTTKLIDYDLTHMMGNLEHKSTEVYLSNSDHTNNMWTYISGASFGFIVPGTSTYAVFGGSGGHDSYVGYKITRSDGTLCGGYCTYEPTDNYGYYWLFDVDDMKKVISGEVKSYDIIPYEYGKFDVALNDTGSKKIIGGCYDEVNEILYLVVNKTGYEPIPAILAYKINKTV